VRDPIFKALGLGRGGDLSPDAFDCLVDHLTIFARAGGVVQWPIWIRMSADTKAALVAANERVQAERAAAIGLATQGKREAARILAGSDGGDLDVELCIDDYTEQIARKSIS